MKYVIRNSKLIKIPQGNKVVFPFKEGDVKFNPSEEEENLINLDPSGRYEYNNQLIYLGPTLIPVPESVPKWQLKIELAARNLLVAVQSIVDQGDDIIKIQWNENPNFRRDHPLVIQISEILGLSEETVDDIFRKAKKHS